MPKREQRLPDYDDPPVIETVVGVSFAPLPSWDLRYFGLFWEEIASDYPGFEVRPVIGEVENASGAGLANLIVRAVGVTQPPIRCWFTDHTKTRLLQLQHDRFLHNWRKVEGDEPYPHYDAIKPHFTNDWNRFERFLKTKNIELPQVRDWEVTYVNHLEKGREWNTLADLPSILKWWRIDSVNDQLASPSVFHLNLRFDIGPATKLTVSLQQAVRHRDNKEVLVLNLTARGRASNWLEALSGIDEGRAIIVVNFDEMTTKTMHKLWKRKGTA